MPFWRALRSAVHATGPVVAQRHNLPCRLSGGSGSFGGMGWGAKVALAFTFAATACTAGHPVVHSVATPSRPSSALPAAESTFAQDGQSVLEHSKKAPLLLIFLRHFG